jgi:hypothetical protein
MADLGNAPTYTDNAGFKQEAQGVFGQVSTSNIATKLREAFEDLSADHWTTVVGTGDIVQVDGNAAAASYVSISKSPWDAGTQTTLETVATFSMPVEIAFGAHRSQATLGQEFAVEFVDTSPPLPAIADIAIAAISQATTVLTIDTVADHGLSVGKSIGIAGCSNPLANYPALVVASTPSPRQFTATAGPGGTIPSQTIANPAGAKGAVYFRERLGRANNGVSQIFENATATNGSFYLRSESGDADISGTIAGNHAITIGSTASVQLVNTAYAYAFSPTTVYGINVQADRTSFYDVAVDSLAQASSRHIRNKVCPDPDATYRLRIRATNNKALTVINAKVISAVKTGTTTATFTTDRPHGLVTGDPITYYGNSNTGAAAFPNLTTATAVTVVDATIFTAVIGTASTVTGYGGVIAEVQGGNLPSALGFNNNSAINATLTTLTDGTRQLVLNGAAAWSGLSIGDYVNAEGVSNVTNGALLGVDGAWKVANAATTALTLVPCTSAFAATLPADFALTNCGGAIIKRTCLRLSFVRIFDYERQRVEMLARAGGDMSAAAPVTIQNVPAISTLTTLTGGAAAEDAPTTANPHIIGGVVRTSLVPTTLVAGDAMRATMTAGGAAVVKPYAVPEIEWSFTGALTTTSDVPVQTAGGAGLKRHVTAIQVTNTGASAVDVIVKDGTTARIQVTIPAGQSVPLPLPTGIPLTANTALNVALSAAGTVRFNALGYTAP